MLDIILTARKLETNIVDRKMCFEVMSSVLTYYNSIFYLKNNCNVQILTNQNHKQQYEVHVDDTDILGNYKDGK